MHTFTCSPAKTASRNRPLPSCSEYIGALNPLPFGIRVCTKKYRDEKKGKNKIKRGNIRVVEGRVAVPLCVASLYDKGGRSSSSRSGGGGSMYAASRCVYPVSTEGRSGAWYWGCWGCSLPPPSSLPSSLLFPSLPSLLHPGHKNKKKNKKIHSAISRPSLCLSLLVARPIFSGGTGAGGPLMLSTASSSQTSRVLRRSHVIGCLCSCSLCGTATAAFSGGPGSHCAPPNVKVLVSFLLLNVNYAT